MMMESFQRSPINKIMQPSNITLEDEGGCHSAKHSGVDTHVICDERRFSGENEKKQFETENQCHHNYKSQDHYDNQEQYAIDNGEFNSYLNNQSNRIAHQHEFEDNHKREIYSTNCNYNGVDKMAIHEHELGNQNDAYERIGHENGNAKELKDAENYGNTDDIALKNVHKYRYEGGVGLDGYYNNDYSNDSVKEKYNNCKNSYQIRKDNDRRINAHQANNLKSDFVSPNIEEFCKHYSTLSTSQKLFGSERVAQLMRYPKDYVSPQVGGLGYHPSLEELRRITPAGKETDWGIWTEHQIQRHNNAQRSTEVAKHLRQTTEAPTPRYIVSGKPLHSCGVNKKNDSANAQIIFQPTDNNSFCRTRLLCAGAKFDDSFLVPELREEKNLRKRVDNTNSVDSIDVLVKNNFQNNDKESDNQLLKNKKFLPHTMSYQIDNLLHNRFVSGEMEDDTTSVGISRKHFGTKDPNPYRWGVNVLEYGLPTPKKKIIKKENNLDANFVPFKSSDQIHKKRTRLINVSHMDHKLLPIEECSLSENASGILTRPDKVASRLEPTFVPAFEDTRSQIQVNPKKNLSQLQGSTFIATHEGVSRGKRYTGINDICQLKAGSCKLFEKEGSTENYAFSKKMDPKRFSSKFNIAWNVS